MSDLSSLPNDPAGAALHEALDKLVFSHPEAHGTAGWVLTLDRATPFAFAHEPVSGPTRLLMSIDANVTRVEVVHPEADDAEGEALTVPLTVDVVEQLVPALLDLVDNDANARAASDTPCVHCGGLGRALPLWRTR